MRAGEIADADSKESASVLLTGLEPDGSRELDVRVDDDGQLYLYVPLLPRPRELY
jgi:hypothetical protein